MERLVGNSDRQRVFFFHQCKLGLQGSVHNSHELQSQAWAHDIAAMDKPLGSTDRK